MIFIKAISIASFLFMLVSCSKDVGVHKNIDYSKYVTIKQGLWGSCIFREGDCQPIGTCKEYPVKRIIYIYQLTPISQTIQLGGANSSFFSQINTPLVAQTESNEIGFYQVPLQQGQYSILIKEDGKYYSGSCDGQGNITSVTINSNTTTARQLIIDYNAVY